MQHHRNHTETRGIEKICLVHSMLQSSVWGKPQPDSYTAVRIEEKTYDADVYMCLVVTWWEKADLLALVCGV